MTKPTSTWSGFDNSGTMAMAHLLCDMSSRISKLENEISELRSESSDSDTSSGSDYSI